MIRSFHYAAYVALRGQVSTRLRPEDLPMLEEWAQAWYFWVSATFLKSYLEFTAGIHVLPQTREGMKIILDAYLLNKAIYEVDYELNNRPDWVGLPLKGVLQVLGAHEEPAAQRVEKKAEEEPVRIVGQAGQKPEKMTKEAEGKAKKKDEK